MNAQEGTFSTLGHTDVTIGDAAAQGAELERRMRDEGGHAGVAASCRPITDILTRVGDKWSVMVVILLGNGTKRFNEMRRLIGGISQRMLTLTLRGLERDGPGALAVDTHQCAGRLGPWPPRRHRCGAAGV